MTPEEQTISEILSLDGGERFKVVNVLIKNRAVAFGNWLQFNYQPHAETGFYYDHHNDQSGLVPISTEELYTLFLTQNH